MTKSNSEAAEEARAVIRLRQQFGVPEALVGIEDVEGASARRIIDELLRIIDTRVHGLFQLEQEIDNLPESITDEGESFALGYVDGVMAAMKIMKGEV